MKKRRDIKFSLASNIQHFKFTKTSHLLANLLQKNATSIGIEIFFLNIFGGFYLSSEEDLLDG